MTAEFGNNAGEAFADLVDKIFKLSGYETKRNVKKYEKNGAERDIDIIATNDENSYYVEVKYSMQKHVDDLSRYANVILFIDNIARANHAIPVFVIMAKLGSECKAEYEGLYEDLIILDISNLLFGIKGTKTHSELLAFLPYSIDDIVPKEGKLNVSFLEHSALDAEYIEKLRNCPIGKEGARQFEKICTEMLKYSFDRELTLWKEQYKSNNELYRFDLLCRIKDDNEKTLWRMVQNFFHSKYVIFEYKNYEECITQKEIYTTERYLYAKALRNVAIVVARNGYDGHSQWAAKGCLRESGKLIILISSDELIEICNLKSKNEEPSEFLLNKLDNMLAELEK